MPNVAPYVKPPAPEAKRRVYVLPAATIRAIREYGFQNGCRSEAEAVRLLLDAALKAKGV